MAELEAVTWTKLVITGVPGMECGVRVTKDGRALDPDGDPIPFENRPYNCGRDGAWMLGSMFMCKEHARQVAQLMDDDIDEIDAAWKRECL